MVHSLQDSADQDTWERPSIEVKTIPKRDSDNFTLAISVNILVRNMLVHLFFSSVNMCQKAQTKHKDNKHHDHAPE